MPEYLCWECAALLTKFNLFRRKCERAYHLLQDVINTHDEFNEIKEKDRIRAKLTSSLIRCNITHSFYDPITSDYKNDFSDSESNHFEFDLNLVKKDDIEEINVVTHLNLVKKDDIEEINVVTHKNEQQKNYTSLSVSGSEVRDKSKENAHKSKQEYCDTEINEEDTFASKKKFKKPKLSSDLNRNESKCSKKLKNSSKTTNKANLSPQISAKKLCEGFATIVEMSQSEQMLEIRKRQEAPAYRRSQYKCEMCYKGFMDERAFHNHKLKHELVSGKFECDVCKIRFRSRKNIQNHIYSVHMSKYVCKLCEHVSTNLAKARMHHKWHAGVTYSCEICGETSNKATTHLSHVRLKHPSPHICAACGRSFVSDKGLAMHSRLMHKESSAGGDGGGEWRCGACAVQFESLAARKQHMALSHRDEEGFGNGCRHCGETFPTPGEYLAHYRLAHRRRRAGGGAWDRPRQCEHCPETVPSAMHYYWHIRKSHPGKRYQTDNMFICEICGRDFKFNASLTHHRCRDGGAAQYACAKCPRAFPTRAQRDKHATVHSDARPYSCDICGKAFKEKTALARHIRYHSGARPYLCDTCGKAFTESSSRKLHVRTVHLGQPAPCISRARLERRRLAAAQRARVD